MHLQRSNIVFQYISICQVPRELLRCCLMFPVARRVSRNIGVGGFKILGERAPSGGGKLLTTPPPPQHHYQIPVARHIQRAIYLPSVTSILCCLKSLKYLDRAVENFGFCGLLRGEGQRVCCPPLLKLLGPFPPPPPPHPPSSYAYAEDKSDDCCNSSRRGWTAPGVCGHGYVPLSTLRYENWIKNNMKE